MLPRPGVHHSVESEVRPLQFSRCRKGSLHSSLEMSLNGSKLGHRLPVQTSNKCSRQAFLALVTKHYTLIRRRIAPLAFLFLSSIAVNILLRLLSCAPQVKYSPSYFSIFHRAMSRLACCAEEYPADGAGCGSSQHPSLRVKKSPRSQPLSHGLRCGTAFGRQTPFFKDLWKTPKKAQTREAWNL